MPKIDFTKLDAAALKDIVVVAAKDQIHRDLGDETVILNMKTGVYCGLNETGSRIWQLIQEPKSVRELLDTLIKEYDVEASQCEKGLLALLNQMANSRLIEINA